MWAADKVFGWALAVGEGTEGHGAMGQLGIFSGGELMLRPAQLYKEKTV